jgi:hypothetical protein
MLNAFSRDIRSICAQENTGVHSVVPSLVEHVSLKVILTNMVRSSPLVYPLLFQPRCGSVLYPRPLKTKMPGDRSPGILFA